MKMCPGARPSWPQYTKACRQGCLRSQGLFSEQMPWTTLTHD